jgi:hypothetical protein
MTRVSILLFLCLFTPLLSWPQITPPEDAVLNYRLIGFSFQPLHRAANYKIEIAYDNDSTDALFKKNIINSIITRSTKIIIEVPSFGSSYTWRVVATDSLTHVVTYRTFHHFNTAIVHEVDTNMIRFRVLDTAVKFKDDYVFLDGAKTLYDMKGHPVWFLPAIDGDNSFPIDIKLSAWNTVTFVLNSQAYEVNYDGSILWKKQPGNEKTEGPGSFHHEFTRIGNGHYMVLGNESVNWHRDNDLSKNNPATGNTADTPGNGNLHAMFGTILEYDEKGNLVWSWGSSGYFMGSDLVNFTPRLNKAIDVHENAFYFDEVAGAIYVSFKIISRVLKIKYPEGTILNVYGETFKPGASQKNDYLFCDQHSCKHSEEGYMYVYNNNSCHNNPLDLPKISVFKEPPAPGGELETVWEYQCNADGVNMTRQLRVPQKDLRGMPLPQHQTSGGNVIEMPDKSMFVSMCGPYCKVFIVSRDKKILWCALPERYNAVEKIWNPISEYRATIITRRQLEALVWNSLKTGQPQEQK